MSTKTNDLLIANALKEMRVTCPIVIEAEKLHGVLTSAFEGGSNYWIRDLKVLVKPTCEWRYAADVVFFGGQLQVNLLNPKDVEIVKPLTLAGLQDAVKLLAEKWPWHAADLIKDNGDATTGDVLLQCAIFGDIVYG